VAADHILKIIVLLAMAITAVLAVTTLLLSLWHHKEILRAEKSRAFATLRHRHPTHKGHSQESLDAMGTAHQ